MAEWISAANKKKTAKKRYINQTKLEKSKALEISPSLVMSPECSIGTHALQQNNN